MFLVENEKPFDYLGFLIAPQIKTLGPGRVFLFRCCEIKTLGWPAVFRYLFGNRELQTIQGCYYFFFIA